MDSWIWEGDLGKSGIYTGRCVKQREKAAGSFVDTGCRAMVWLNYVVFFMLAYIYT